MIAQRSMFCTCKKSKIGEVLPLLLCYTVPCAEDQLKAKAPWHENVIQAKVFVAYHNDETAKKLADTIRAAGVTNVKTKVCNAETNCLQHLSTGWRLHQAREQLHGPAEGRRRRRLYNRTVQRSRDDA